jgi:hypothetical protein
VQRENEEPCDPECDPASFERGRDGKRHDQEAGHPPEQEQPIGENIRCQPVAHPDEAVVRVPDDGEEEHHPGHAHGGRLGGEQGGELREREDEDEVEEELERRNADHLVGRLIQGEAIICPGLQDGLACSARMARPAG